MSYAAPIIHHDFTSSVNKGTLTDKFDIDNFADIVVDTDNKQVGTASMYTGEIGKSVVNLGPDYSTPSEHKFTTGLTGGFFVSYWVKHGYSLTDSPFYYTKKTKADLIDDDTLLPKYGEAHFQNTTSPDSADHVLGIVNQTYFNITRSNGAILYGYNAISTSTITELLWAGNSLYTLRSTSVSTADGATTVGVYDGGEDFHHMVLSYHDMTTDVYVDGNLKTTYNHGNTGTDYIFNNTSFYKLSLGQTLLDTYINDFRVYNYAADTTMIDMIYKLGKNTDLASLSGAPMSSLQNAGATMSQLITAGISITELLNVYTVAELVAANVTIEQLVAGGVTAAQLLEEFTQTQIDIALTNIKIHSDFTISDGEQNESAFVTEYISPDNPFNAPNVFASTDAKTTTGLIWKDIEISSTGQYQIAVVNAGNVWISSNFGETWLEKIVGGGVQSWRYAMISGDGSTMIARADEQILWKSTDSGTTWASMSWNSAESTTYYSDVMPMKLAYDGNHMCSAIMTNTNTDQGMYSLTLSTDGGVNWSTVSSTNGRIDTLSMSKSGQYIVIIYGDDTTKPKYSDDYGVTFITLTNGHTYSQHANGTSANSMATISDTGKLWHRYWREISATPNAALYGIDVNTGTVTNGENDAALTVYSLDRPAAAGKAHTINSSNDGKNIIFTGYEQWGQPRPQTMFISTDYGVSFTNYDSTSPLYISETDMPANKGAIRGCRFSDDNKYVAVVREEYYIYVRKNTFIQGIYTPTTFAAKLTADLSGNNVTAGGDLITTDSTPYYRMYLEFANAVTLTGMPKDIFNIPFSDFSVGAGGQVNLRNVNLDAQMTINANYNEHVPFGLMAGDIYYTNYGKTAISGDGNRIAISNITGQPSYTGSLTANGTGSSTFGHINIYERDTNAASGWTQLGETIYGGCVHEEYGQNVSMSHDGEIVVAGSHRNSIDYTGDVYGDIKHFQESLRGYFQAWKRDASSTVNPVGWVKYGNAILGKVHQDRGFCVKISGDGNSIVATCRNRVNYVEVYKYSTPGQTGGTWDLQGNTFNGNTTSGHDDYYLSMNLSYDGNILAIGNSTYNSNNGRVQVYQRDTNAATGWTQLGNDIVGTGGEEFGGSAIYGATNLIIADNGNKLAVMSENYSNAQSMVVGRVSIYKRDTNVALGWSLIGNPIENPISTEKNFDTMDISEDGNRVVIGISEYDDGNITNAGRSYVYDYNSTTLAWEHIITNSQTSSTDPITGTSNDDYLSAIVISADGFKQAVRRNDKIYTYQLPGEVQFSNTSIIPANNYFINNFVSTIETDLVNYTLSYDASNALIEFVGLGQDISMNITSNDTTIFDTTITEITTAANTLPFLSYGQPDPTISQYIDNGITASEFLSNGYTIPQLFAAGVIPDWAFVTDANHFDQSYVKGFVDLSGSLVIRNDNKLITNGELSLGGNLTVNSPGTTSFSNESMTLKSHLFMGEDISANSNVYIGGDLSVNGQFSGNFANDIIPLSAISSAGAGGIDISGNVLFAGDVSFNGPTVDVNIPHPPLRISDSILSDDEYTLNSITYKLIPLSSPVAITGVSINSLDDIEPHSALITGPSVSNTFKCVFYKYEDANGDIVPNNWICGSYNLGITKVCRIEFTLNSSISSIQQISRAYNNGTLPDTKSALGNGDYTSSAADLSRLFNDNTVGSVFADLNYALTDFYYNYKGLTNNLNSYTQLIPASIGVPVVGYVTSGTGPTYNVLPLSPAVIPNVTVYSLGQIELVNADMFGANVTNGPIPCTIYKYQDENGSIVPNNWVCGISPNTSLTQAVLLEFTLNGTDLLVAQLGRAYTNANTSVLGNANYTSTAADLSILFNDNSYVYYEDLNYAITNASIKVSNPPIQANLIEFSDGTMTTHDDNILSGTFADSNVVFKDSTFASVICQGVANAASTTETSDYRIKENVTELNETDTVDALVPIQYNNTVSGNHEFGLLAHELQEIYPDLVVGEKDGAEYQRVHYNGLIGVLVKEIQGLKQRLAVLNK